MVILAIMLMSFSILNYGRYLYLKSIPDTRDQAREWMQREIPNESKILKSFYSFLPSDHDRYRIVWLDPTVFDTRKRHVSKLKSLASYRQEGYQYLIIDDWHTGMILQGTRGNPKYKDQVLRYSEFISELEKNAELLASFSPYAEGEGENFDAENVEFASRHLWGMRRLGPLIRIYRL